MVRSVYACTGTAFSVPLIISKGSFCFYGVILGLYHENLLATGGELCRSCQEPASDSCAEIYHCMHRI
jgi:hypothetical protein